VVAAYVIAFCDSNESVRSPIADSWGYVRLRVSAWQPRALGGDDEGEQTAMNTVDARRWRIFSGTGICQPYFAAPHLSRDSVPRDSDTGRIASIHEPFSEVSPTVGLTIMQAAGHLHNLGIVFRRVLTQEIVMKNVFKTQSNLAKFIVAAGIFALASTAIGRNAPAHEATAAESPAQHSTTNWLLTYPVRYSDLNLSKMKGAKTLYLRIRYAAETLCQSAATWGKKEGEVCVRKAIDDAVTRVDSPLLSQYYQLRSKGDKAGLVQLAKAN
jgi:UrcA family protein